MHSCREKAKWDHTVLEQKVVEEWEVAMPSGGGAALDVRVEYVASAGIMLVIKPTDRMFLPPAIFNAAPAE